MALTRPTFDNINSNVSARINDPLVVINAANVTANNQDIGFVFNRGTTGNVAFGWSETVESFVLVNTSSSGQVNANLEVIGNANLRIGNLTTTGVSSFTGNMIAGHILPAANVTYDLGSPTNRFRTLYIAGNTIDFGGATIKADETGIQLQTLSGSVFNFNDQTGFSQETTSANNAGTFSSLTVTGESTLAGNVVVGNIKTDGYFYANGIPYVPEAKAGGSTGQVQYNNSDQMAGASGLTTDGNNLTSTGTITAATVNAAEIGNTGATLTGTVQTASQTNITEIGNITTGTWSATPIEVEYGGTGATTAAAARTNLGLAIGTDVQAYNATLAAVANGTYTGDDSITTVGTLTNLTVTNTITGSVSGNAGSATKLATARTIALTGDVTGSGTFDGSGNLSIDATIAANSVVLGTDTIGNYVASVATTAPLSGGATGSEGGALTLSLESGYGDTQNPYASKTANYFLAAPNETAGAPTFRAIVAADIPTLNQNTTGTASNVTGTVAIANGGTGATTAANALTNLGAYAASNPAGYTTNTGTVTSITAGSYLTGGTITASGTIAVDAAPENTASKVVARDANGSFSANIITATLSGVATSATTATNLAGGGAGQIPYQTASGTTAMLAAGTAGYVLTSNGANAPSWEVATGGGLKYTTADTAPGSSSAGDFWYDTSANILYQRINNGITTTWVDQSTLPSTYETLTVTNNATVSELTVTGNSTVSTSLRVNSNNNVTAIVNLGTSGTGNIGASGATFNTVFAKATTAQYADLAENYLSDSHYSPGTVVVFGGEQEITVSDLSHDSRVAGVISTNPGFLMNEGQTAGLPVAFTGRVPCRVQGPVNKGDVLVNVSEGVAGKLDAALYNPGCILGKSLEKISDSEIKTIEVVVGRF